MRHWMAVCALLACASASAAVPSSQRNALIAIYDATGGDSWNDKTGWKGAEGTECQWYGVGCDDAGANVVSLELYANNLRGAFPTQFRDLPRLANLQLWDNVLTGPLPPEIGQLADLETLYVHRNELSGVLPKEIGALKKLARLGLDGNHIEGPLPKELGDLVALEELGLSYNAITGPIPPELGRLTNLVQLELSVNQISGTLPKELGALHNLEQFGLTVNQVSGAIPKELGDLVALAGLRLSYNQLEGTIPPEFGRLKNLQDLTLAVNKLHSPIPKELGDLSSLRFLYLNGNEFDGTFPVDFLRLTNLEEISIGENKFIGEIPRGINALTKLQVLSFYANQFTGTIPTEIASMTSLRTIELQSNDLSGTIPTAIGDLSALTWIDLSGNQLSGTIPSTLGKLANLDVLSLYDNQLEGTIPPELGALTKLTVLYLGINRLSGTIPESFRNLKELRSLYLPGNSLTGNIPTWIGELTNLIDLSSGYNLFTGTIPPSIGNLSNLNYLDLSLNHLSGRIPPELGNLRKLITIDLGFNELEGPIPTTFSQIESMTSFVCEFNTLSGPLPRELGNLRNLEQLRVSSNDLDGAIPAEIGNLTKLYNFAAYGNRFTGAIPRELGKLTALQYLDLSYNALKGSLPSELVSLTLLEDGYSDLNFNALFTTDPALRAFLARKLYDPSWDTTQMSMPTNVSVTQTSDRSATLEWSLIPYQYDPGGYQVVASTTAGGAPAVIATTSSKEINSIVVRNLKAETTYFFTVTAITHPHSYQQNLLASDPTAPVSATTGPRVDAPADVVLTEPTSGLVQVAGVPRNEDSFTLTNFGDANTAVTLFTEGDFFTVAPESFVIDGGKSQVVTVKSKPQPVGTYYGYALASGEGTGDGVFMDVVLLSTARPAGTVVAQALSTRIESSGVPGSTSVGVARFKNVGTATLSGILVSDEPWVQPSRDPITIDPDVTVSVNFNIVRSKRPAIAGALTANLSLLYVDGAPPTLSALDGSTSGISVTTVTVVDVTTPKATPATLGAPNAGEVTLFASGIASFLRASGVYGSDLSIVNARSASAISDLRLFFTAAGASQSSVAELTPISSSQSVSLVNVVTNVYGTSEGVGTLQLRSTDWESLAVGAKLTNLKPTGTFSGDVPVFRADRSTIGGEAIYLVGVRKPADVYVQETSGKTASARLEFLDANGVVISAIDRALGAFELAELKDAVPAGAVTAIVTNQKSSNGRLAAYARVSDDASGDTWSIVDWSRYFSYKPKAAVRVPFADGRSTSAPAKRRAIAPNAAAVRQTTDLALFNPTNAELRTQLQIVEASGHVIERDVAVGARKTVFVADVGGSATSTTAQVIVEPLRGEIIVTARSARSGAGAAIPVVDAESGLRIGQSQVFAGLDDSTSSTTLAATPATFRSSYGFVETSGESVTVRARLIVNEERAIASATLEREFSLGPRQQVVLPELVRSFAGDARDTAFGNLHGLRLQIEIIGGRGSVVPFVIVTDNGSGDSVLRLE